MKSQIILLLVVLISAASGFSQTKLVAHRSHSGKNAGFTINSVDNLGLNPEVIRSWDSIRILPIDSVRKTDSLNRKKQQKNINKRSDSIKTDTLRGSALPTGNENYSSASLVTVVYTGSDHKDNKMSVWLFWTLALLTAILVAFEFTGKKQRHILKKS